MYNKRSFAVSPRAFGGFFEDVFQNGWNQLQDEVNTVPVNILETDKSYELHVVAPGLKKEDFKLHIDKNILNISVENKEEKTDQPEQSKCLRNEYRVKSFKRSFNLNEKVDVARIAAKYTDGILNISLPKKEMAEPTAHEISVN